jgi:ubiquitin carboxyl-terminal hydrolase 7
LESLRPHYYLKPNPEQDERNSQITQVDGLDSENFLYVELGPVDRLNGYRLPTYNEESDLLYFLKYYNHERKLTEFKGTIVVKMDKTWAAYLPEIADRLDLPENTHLNLFMEASPDSILPLRNLHRSIRDDQNYLIDGGIIIAEVADKVTSDNDVQSYFANMYNRIEVEAHVNADGFGTAVNSPAPPIKGVISLNWSMPKLCEWIGKEIDFDPTHVLLWKVTQHSEKPSMCLSRDLFAQYTVRELLSLHGPSLHDPRVGRIYKIFYTKLPIPTAALESRRQFRIQALFEKFQMADLTVFPDKNGTAQSLLDEARRDFKFSENGTGVLRLVHIGHGTTCHRVYQVIDNSLPLSEVLTRFSSSFATGNIQIRVEEVPRDQLEIGRDEKLFPVAHYDKEPNRMHGVPFFLKIVDGEPIVNIRRRIRELLEVPEREFEKYKFTIVMNNRVVRELENDENALVNLSELQVHTHVPTPTSAPFLGIDHMNKSRGSRGTHTTEKAIVIHN